MFKFNDKVIYKNMYEGTIKNIDPFRHPSEVYKIFVKAFNNTIYCGRGDIEPIKNKSKPRNYYSKFNVGEKIKTLDELMNQENVVFINGDLRKIYNKGWVNSFQLRYAQNLINDGHLYKTKLK